MWRGSGGRLSAGRSYLEVIGKVVVAAARGAKQKSLVLRGAALGLVRRGRMRVGGIRVLLGSGRVLDVGGHGCGRLRDVAGCCGCAGI